MDALVLTRLKSLRISEDDFIDLTSKRILPTCQKCEHSKSYIVVRAPSDSDYCRNCLKNLQMSLLDAMDDL